MLKKQNVGGDHGLIKLNFKKKKNTRSVVGWWQAALVFINHQDLVTFRSSSKELSQPQTDSFPPVNPFTFKGWVRRCCVNAAGKALFLSFYVPYSSQKNWHN